MVNEKEILVVLGMRLRNDIISELECRLNKAIEEFHKRNKPIIITSGGFTNRDNTLSEAQFMMEYLVSKNIPTERIIKEEKSLDTIGNAFFTLKIIQNYPSIESVIVITSKYHIERSKFIFSNIYNGKYTLIFDVYCNYENIKNKELEDIKMKYTIEFFNELHKSDISEIERKLYSMNSVYKKYNI